MQLDRFKGLNNVSDPLRVGFEWLTQADNVDVTDTGGLVERTGYALAMAASPNGAFSTFDFSRMYLVDGRALKAMTSPTTADTLRSGLAAAPMYFAEVNEQVYFNNGTDSGIIAPDNTLLLWSWPRADMPQLEAVTGNLPAGLYRVVCTFTLPDGRETGAGDAAEITLGEGSALQISGIPHQADCLTNVYIAPANSTVFQWAGAPRGAAMVWNTSPDALGVELLNPLLDPLPAGCDVIQAWGGRMYAAQYLPQQGQSVIWFSQPLGFHLFDLTKDFIMVPGRVLTMAWHDDGLVIGTDKAIYAETVEKFVQLAPYGVVPGWCTARDENDDVYLWTTRGACRALPFKNLTAGHVSVAPGVQAGAAVIHAAGQKRFVASLHAGGTAFNPFNRS